MAPKKFQIRLINKLINLKKIPYNYLNMDSEKKLKNHIHDLETKLDILNRDYNKLDIKLSRVQNNYERMDILYDKVKSILNDQQKNQLEQFINDFDK